MTGTVSNLTEEDGASITLYAAWEPYSYRVVFDPNGGSGAMAAQTIRCGASAALAANAFTRAGHAFAGWSDDPAGGVLYADRATVRDLAAEDGAEVVFYAVWTPWSYKIAFNANGGSGSIATMDAKIGQAATLPSASTVATDSSEEVHVSAGVALAGSTVACSVSVLPRPTMALSRFSVTPDAATT